MTGTTALPVRRTAAFLFGTFLLSHVLVAADLATPASAWEPVRDQARLAYQHLDFVAARDLASRALALADSASAPEIEIAGVLNVLGASLLGLNKPAEAAPLLDRALSIRRRVLPSPSLDLAVSLNNHASALLSTDAIERARAAAAEAVAMFEALGETKRFEYGVALNNLAAARSNLGDYGPSIPIYEHAREIFSAQLPPDSPRLARLLVNEGVAVQRLGDLARAGSLYESAVELARCAPAIDAIALPNALNALGDLRTLQGRLSDAEPLVTEALSLANAAVPPDQHRTGVIEATLARICQRRGNLQAAAEHFESALTALRTAQATAPLAYASELNNYGLLLLSMKRLGPAGDAFEQAQRIFDSKLGATHPNSVAVTVNRGTLAERRHQFSRAAELYRKAIDLDTAHFGRDHFRVALDINSLGVFEHRRRHYPEAEPLLREALSILRSAWGPDHPEVGLLESNLAHTLWMLKRYADAEPVLADAIRVLEHAYGSDSPKLLSLYDDYAQLLSANEHYAESENAKLTATRIRYRQAYGKASTFN
jgi:hypothetical protein